MNESTDDSDYIELADGVTWQVLRLHDDQVSRIHNEELDSVVLSTGGEGAHELSLANARALGRALLLRAGGKDDEARIADLEIQLKNTTETAIRMLTQSCETHQKFAQVMSLSEFIAACPSECPLCLKAEVDRYRTRVCESCGKPTRITTAGCDHCDVEDK